MCGYKAKIGGLEKVCEQGEGKSNPIAESHPGRETFSVTDAVPSLVLSWALPDAEERAGLARMECMHSVTSLEP